MKLFLTLFLYLSIIYSNDSIITTKDVENVLKYDEEEPGCKAVFLDKKDKKDKNCSTKPKKITITPISIPDEKDKKIANIEEQLAFMQKEFLKYKELKEKETKEISTELSSIKEKFKDYKSAKSKKIVSKKTTLPKKKKILKTTTNKKREIVKKKKVIEQKLDPTPTYIPTTKNISWIELKIEHDYTIYELAEKYYDDREEYKQIYAANRNIIGKDMKLENGMILKIPVTEKFEDQPQILGWN